MSARRSTECHDEEENNMIQINNAREFDQTQREYSRPFVCSSS